MLYCLCGDHMFFLFSLCDNEDMKNIFMVIVNIIKLFCIIAPIITVLFISIDFGKAVIAGSAEDMRDEVKLVVKRLIYCVIVFLVPFIVAFVISLLKDSGVKISSCFTYDEENIEKIDNKDSK